MRFTTDRLRCEPLTVFDYDLFAQFKEPDWEAKGIHNKYQIFSDGPNPLIHRIPRVLKDPAFAGIAIILAIEKTTGELVGSAGFHDWPDEAGMIEIGFGIAPARQNQGLGRELLLGMWLEIIEDPKVRMLRYTVAPDNPASIRVVNHFGFELVGEQIDEIDGIELVYEMPAETFRKLNK